ncbi:DUF3696 domain-containing protein [Thalassolituus oleivorans]|uniref:DUF3696 domain-containing protein n=1 Tax=Thalassolituus oleivorans TaxID=187493 RepID=UPI00042DDAB8|nr:DUF3696 domain-containing protein [Thalassolituus oleivorans]AHK17364.1 hypothetical protein R615_04415 [Thalassolituus oleivorans R6-15]
MFHSVSISNFKAFQENQDISLSPITLICGPNSSGKSSIIQAIMLMKQSLGKPGDYAGLVSNGEYVELGGYNSMVNNHDDSKDIKFSFDFDAPEELKTSSIGYYRLFGKKHKRRVSLSYHLHKSNSSGYREVFTHLKDIRFSIYLVDNTRDSYEFSLSSKLNDESSEFTPELSRQFQLIDEESKEQFSRLIMRRLEGDKSRERKLINLCNELVFLSDVTYSTPASVKLANEKGITGKPESFMEVAFSHTVMNSLSTEFHEKFSDIAYLGPLRSYPSRLYSPKGEQSNSVGKLGEHAARILHEKPKICEAINEWFSQFDIPYDITTENIGNDVTGMVISLQLKDKRTGVIVGPSDVGFGIGQLLPILVEGLVRDESTILVEQPEIHLHPRLQANIADFLIATIPSKNNGKKSSTEKDFARNQWIVETHSEALILRLQRRVREKKLSHKDISIIYVDPDTNGGNVTQIKLDESGDFIDEWPDGFFDERLQEIFGDK